MQHCTLCGVPCGGHDCYRLVDASAVQATVRDCCAPTAMHYASVLALPAEGRRALCPFCVSWSRRANALSAKRRAAPARPRKPVLTPFDSVLLHSLAPGHFPEPDERSFARLAAVVASRENAFASLVPWSTRPFLGAGSEEPLDGERALDRRRQAATWWALNERTSFFRHGETAKTVRHACVVDDPAQRGSRKRLR